MKRRIFAIFAAVVLLGGCFETKFAEDPNDPYWPAYYAELDAKKHADTTKEDVPTVADATEDTAPDVTVDTSPDTAPDAAADAADTAVDTAPDTAADTEDTVDTQQPDTAQPDVPPEDTGPPKLPLGATCTADAECTDNNCLKVDASKSVCTRTCSGVCPAGFRCQLAPQTGSTSIHYCMPLPGDLCRTCKSDGECLGGLCLTMEGTGEKLCGLFCDAAAGGAAVCPVGFDCQSFIKGEMCVPTNNTCTCDNKKLGSFWPCGVATPIGTCSGIQACTADGWSLCNALPPVKESCDGIDNNCNGKTDETFAATIDGVDVPLGGPCGKGVCAGGTVICSNDGKKTACSTDLAFPPKDQCDKLDNDCDGQTDEDCPPKDTDADGTPDKSDCQPYNAEGFPGAKEPCCLLPIKASATEYEIPVEDFFVDCDWSCDKKVKVCAASDTDGDGFYGAADCGEGDPLRHPGAIEKCDDGVDQDCDGTDVACSSLGIDGDGDGYVQGSDCNDDNKLIHPGAEELCNFKDDDCDGITDDGNPGERCEDPQYTNKSDCIINGGKKWLLAGAPCGETTGECQAGKLVCTHVGLVAAVTCADAKGPEPELCNEKDDNCNGKTDEDFGELGKQCDSDDADQCENGQYVCAADAVGVTCGLESKTDLLETCKAGTPPEGNGIDEDCDSITDEICYGEDSDGDGYPKATDCNDADSSTNPGIKNEPCCDPALKGTALESARCDKNCDGVSTFCDPADKDFDGYFGADDCDETNPERHHKGLEKCDDGIDQDCDNEDLKCSAIAGNDSDGDGYANAIDCAPDDPNRHPGAIEACNHKDDDCDGFTDEDNAGAQAGGCGSSLGECKPGKEVCVFQKFKSVLLCVPDVGPSPELCNGKDDNCNGKVDEYFVLLGKPCDGPDSDKCERGTWTCAADGNGLVCNNETTADIVELCDGIDNDCDGETDEGHVYFGKKVGEKCQGLGACGAGTVVCSPELRVAVCSTDAYGTEPKSQPELCDNIDNDCDGLTDEGMLFDGKAVGAQCLGNGACADVVGKVQCPSGGGTSAICSTMLGGTDYKGSAEVCNGLDDNCDGHVDEGLKVKDSDCKQAGICALGGVKAKCRGGSWTCNYDGVVGYQGEKEVFCDGQDNDCDGKTDDEFGIGMPCDGTDTDQCAFGQRFCNADKLASTCGPESQSDIKDICDGKDNDCDGDTDEDFPVHKKCDGPDSDSCANGTWTCVTDGSAAECVNETAKDLVEVCDELDNDCDGKTNEGFANLGDACDGPDSDQCKNGVVTCSVDKKSEICGVELKQNIEDVCNGKDDDCNGKTDDDPTYNTFSDVKLGKKIGLGGACNGFNQGNPCGEGKVVCQPKAPFKATCSTQPDAFAIFEGKELCDGLDNDCDGQKDNGLAWKGIAKGNNCDGIGVCGKGIVECGTDQNVTCSTLLNGTKSEAKKEACNNLDDDCDGETDEAIPLEESTCRSKGVCATNKVSGVTPVVFKCDSKNSVWTCDYSAITTFEKIETLCDGLDNDCDGLTDEGFNVGDACDGDDSDKCKTGTWRCTADNKTSVCDNEKMTDIPEVCDEQDNDCDGDTDEDFTYGSGKLQVGQACDGVGECGAGKVMCHPQLPIAICDTDPGGPKYTKKEEVCDAKDNDCNGVTDDGFKYKGLPVGAPCSGIGECGLGKVECNPTSNQVACSVNPDGTQSKAIGELCNNKDDNCDGATDNAVDAKTTSCNSSGQCAKALTTDCVSGKWTCQYAGSSWEKEETLCDGFDNDCDGKTDEPFPDKGKACDGPDEDSCKNGLLLCSNNAQSLVCGPEKPVSPVELCDGLDNDCNGKTDEPFPELGKDCDGPDDDSCANGVFTCAASGKSVQCINEFPSGIKELCDGQDNDCDGQTDEDFNIGKPCDGDDADKCANGVWVCGKDGKPTCDEKASALKKEICNGKDDDCDDETDEEWPEIGLVCDGGDTDKCRTGVYGCSNDALVCLGDSECAVSTECVKGDGSKTPDRCMCDTVECSFAQGDNCAGGKTCQCNGKAMCGFGQTCAPGQGCKSQ